MNRKGIKELEELIQQQYSNMAGIVVYKDGKLVYENYFDGYTAADTIHIASVTKSILSALIGIAIEKGCIRSIDQNVLEFFKGYTLKRGEKTIRTVTVKNLLTMTAPYKYRSEPYTKVYSSDDWVKAALDLLGGRGSVGTFRYSTVGTQILSGILMNATSQPVVDFAVDTLFEPLKIHAPHSKVIRGKEEHFSFLKNKYADGWVVDPQGVNTAGWGLTLTPRDMAKIGQLYLDGGMWEGSRILPSAWIEDSTKENSRFGELPYGYLWWIVDDCYAAMGDGGNIIFVNPVRNMVVASASRFLPRAKDRIELIKNSIEPLFD